MPASIFSAGLNQKENQHQVTFASIQSLANNLDTFNQFYSLIIIDEWILYVRWTLCNENN